MYDFSPNAVALYCCSHLGQDAYGPAKVTDLTVVCISFKEVILEWTASGDDLDKGTGRFRGWNHDIVCNVVYDHMSQFFSRISIGAPDLRSHFDLTDK